MTNRRQPSQTAPNRTLPDFSTGSYTGMHPLMRVRRSKGLITLAIVVLSGVVAVGWWSLHRVKSALEADLQSQLETILQADVAALEVWLHAEERTISSLAHQPLITASTARLISELATGPPLESVLGSESFATLSAHLSEMATELGYVELSLIGQDGRILLSRRHEEVLQRAPADFAPWLDRVLTGGTLVTRPILASVSLPGVDGGWETGRATMFAISPVPDPDDPTGAPLAALLGRLEPERDFTRILQVARSGETGETYAFDAAGLMLSDSRFNPQLVDIELLSSDQSAVLNIQVRDPGGDLTSGYRPESDAQLPLTRMAASAVRGEAGADVNGYRDYRGILVVGAWTWLREYGFGVTTEVDMTEAYRPLRQLEQTFWLLLLLLGAFAMIGLIVMAVLARVQRKMNKALSTVHRLGQYTLEKQLGSGGMGVVYRASHAMLRRPTAIKLLRPERNDEASIRRFQREVQLTSRLTHPNTIAIYDYGLTPEGVFYYAMEYLPGLTLEDLVRQFGPQPDDRVVKILLQICGSLGEAHGEGLIHRDIKPANVILCKRGGLFDVAKVLDFGMVKHLAGDGDASLTEAGAIPGTPHYLAPEVVNDPSNVDHRADLYGLGCVGYFLLTGKTVFDGESPMKVVFAHAKRTPKPMAERLEGRGDPPHARLEAVIMRALAKNPAERPQTAGAFAQLLEMLPLTEWTVSDARAWWGAHQDEVLNFDSQPTPANQSLVIDMAKRLR